MAIRVSQIGHETWVSNPAHLRVSQIGAEAWLTVLSRLRVSQVGVETWRSTANNPQPTTGHADGVAYVWAFTPAAQLTTGHADGYATCASVDFEPPLSSPIVLDMGI